MTGARKGVILLVHGSRDRAWLTPFFELMDQVLEKSPGVRFALACLQFCPPTLEDSLGELSGEGIEKVMIVPVFISSLGHVTKDVPGMVEAAKARYPNCKIELQESLGEQPEVKAAFIESLSRLAENF